ncbi:hypothetical protein BDW75DRAFT_126476 [Aspergillus navahoensis]
MRTAVDVSSGRDTKLVDPTRRLSYPRTLSFRFHRDQTQRTSPATGPNQVKLSSICCQSVVQIVCRLEPPIQVCDVCQRLKLLSYIQLQFVIVRGINHKLAMAVMSSRFRLRRAIDIAIRFSNQASIFAITFLDLVQKLFSLFSGTSFMNFAMMPIPM